MSVRGVVRAARVRWRQVHEGGEMSVWGVVRAALSSCVAVVVRRGCGRAGFTEGAA